MSLFSTAEQLDRIALLTSRFSALPFTPPDSVSGAVLMAILAEVRNATTLSTYDFVDVLHVNHRVGWQVKSTKSGTPVTWKRAKIPQKDQLIGASLGNSKATQALGDAIMEYCNAHARESFRAYDLAEIGYARLVIYPNLEALYFERRLATQKEPTIFNPTDFEWKWSIPKAPGKKEQLSALHGFHRSSGVKWWAWHGQGENQLHFCGEKEWWPRSDDNCRRFKLPSLTEKFSMEDLIEMLESANL